MLKLRSASLEDPGMSRNLCDVEKHVYLAIQLDIDDDDVNDNINKYDDDDGVFYSRWGLAFAR